GGWGGVGGGGGRGGGGRGEGESPGGRGRGGGGPAPPPRSPLPSPRPRQAPYGTQMFFTWHASRRNSGPPPRAGSNQSRGRPWFTQVRFMLPAEARSTFPLPSREPKYQTLATSSCAASTSASSSFGPVTMLSAPPGRSEVSSTW